jgi:hypothetical protein
MKLLAAGGAVAVLLLAGALAWTGEPASPVGVAQAGDDDGASSGEKPAPDKPREKPPREEKPPTKPAAPTPPATTARDTASTPPQPQTDLGALGRSESEPMFGDAGPSGPPISVKVAFLKGKAVPVGVAVPGAEPVPSLRGFKIADHESPEPLDRAYLGFNFYNEVNASIDHRLGSDVRDERVYGETFGLEKTFFDERASVGLRLPLNTLTGESDIPAFGGSSTDVGDLSVILKYAAWRNRERCDLVSVGLAVTTPTGPNAFAGSAQVAPLHSTTLQPYVGYLWNWGDFYLHGFSSVDVPTDQRDVTILYDDVGVGYHLYRAHGCDHLIRGVVPTFEVHVNTPLNHRGALRLGDVAATPDVVDLTLGSYVDLGRSAHLGVGVAMPVTGPRPFDVEAIAHFELRF